MMGSYPSDPEWFVVPPDPPNRRTPPLQLEPGQQPKMKHRYIRRQRIEVAMEAWSDIAVALDGGNARETGDPAATLSRRRSLSSVYNHHNPRLLVHPDVPPPSLFTPPPNRDLESDELVDAIYGEPGAVQVHGGGSSAAFLGNPSVARNERSVVADTTIAETGGLYRGMVAERDGERMELLSYFETLAAVVGLGRTARELVEMNIAGAMEQVAWQAQLAAYEEQIGSVNIMPRQSEEAPRSRRSSFAFDRRRLTAPLLSSNTSVETASSPVAPTPISPSRTATGVSTLVPIDDPPTYDVALASPTDTAPPTESTAAGGLMRFGSGPLLGRRISRSATAPAGFYHASTTAPRTRRRSFFNDNEEDMMNEEDEIELASASLRPNSPSSQGLFQIPGLSQSDAGASAKDGTTVFPRVMFAAGFVERPYPGFLVPGRFGNSVAILVWCGRVMISIPDIERNTVHKYRKWKNRAGTIIRLDWKLRVREGDVFGIGLVRRKAGLGILVTVNGRIPDLPDEKGNFPSRRPNDVEMQSPGLDIWDAVIPLPPSFLVASRADDLLYPSLGSRGPAQLLANFNGPFLWDGAGFTATGAPRGMEESWQLSRDAVDPPPTYQFNV